MVFSASAVVAQERYHSAYTFVGKQAIWALAGVLALLVLMHIDISRYNSPRFIYPALCVTTLLLVLVFLMPGSHNTHRWIRFGDFFTFQPSEIAKPVLVLFLAWFLHTRLDAMRDWKHTLLPAALIPVVFILLIVTQPDLGTALVLAGVTAMMLVLAGMEWKYLFGACCAALPAWPRCCFWVPWRRAAHAGLPPSRIRSAGRRLPHQPVADRRGHRRTDRPRLHGRHAEALLSARSLTDFIFANIAEELGFIGAIFIVLLFAMFGVRGLRAAFRCTDPFARLVAFGITTTILLQAFFNISVVLSLVPTKGIPLPLISHGGTSLFCTLASIGILLNISRQAE